MIAAVVSTAALLTVACTKPKSMPAITQDILTTDMSLHNFATDGYAIINGGWSGVDFKGHILPDDRFGKDNFLQFDVSLKQLQFFTLESESRNGVLPNPSPEESEKTEALLAEIIHKEPGINSANALISFLRLGALGKDYNIGAPQLATLPFTIVTNRDELPYSPKPNAGPEWNQFIRDYCGGFQNPNLGFIWLDNSRKYCLKVWKGRGRQLMRARALVSLARSRTSAVLEARVSPWITFTRSDVTPAPTASPDASPTPNLEKSTKKN